MAPEAFEGKRNVKRDLWSVGVVLYQLLTGSLPFPQSHPTERMFAVLHKEFAPLPNDIPTDLRNIVQKSLAKNPTERYQSAKEMREDLEKILVKIKHPTFAPTEVLDKKDVKIVHDTNKKTIADNSTVTNVVPREIPLPKTEPQSKVLPTVAVLFADKTNKRQINSLIYIGAGVLALIVFAGIIGITALIIAPKPVSNKTLDPTPIPAANEIKVEIKATSEPFSVIATIDNVKAATVEVKADAPQTFIGQQSVRLKYYGSAKPNYIQFPNIQLTVNGKKITAPNPPIKGNAIDFEINKNNIAQILQSGQITDTNATTPSPTPNNPAKPR